MQITIDNADGQGPRNYTAAVAAEGPITIRRELNAPSRCTVEVVPGIAGLPAPVRRGRVLVTSDAGGMLFTGYLTTEPMQLYAGAGLQGALYRLRLQAVSDEWLLDKQGSGSSSATDGMALSVNPGSVVSQITQAVQGSSNTGVTTSVGGNTRALGAFAVQPAAGWSTNAAAAANAAYATYRAVEGVITVASAGTVTHNFNEADGSLDVADLSLAQVRELANDVTLSGEEEPAAYVQEAFQGDGTTTEFALSNAAFRGNNRILLRDSFTAGSFDTTQWAVSDAGYHLALTSAGLAFQGGNGFDGQTLLTAVNAIEMGGAIVAELGGVVFGAASNGMLSGFYNGSPLLANCFAGFRVRQSVSTTAGVTVVVPVVNGTEVGTTFTPSAGHSYTLRLRLWCTEMQRIPQRYYCMVDGAVQEFGQISGISAPMQITLEVIDEGVSSNTPATVLFDSASTGSPISTTPAACSFVAANSINLVGSVASIEVQRTGSVWVVSTLPNGTQTTRLAGAAGEGVDCTVEYGSATGVVGKITFFAGRVPVAQERVMVFYRSQRRAVARLADPASVQAETLAGTGVQVAGVSRWLGKVISPPARSSADCEAAAQAILAIATSRSAAQAGTFALVNPYADVWPGDLLGITGQSTSYSLMVRSATLQDDHAAPEMIRYELHYANDWATEWADGLGLKLSSSIAADALLPASAASGPSEVCVKVQQLAVTALSTSVVQIDAGMAAPSGGGFEVRRRDWNFGVGVAAPDLVLRSPVRNFSLPRAAQKEAFYVRAYDGSTPPLYSRISSAIFLNWPMA